MQITLDTQLETALKNKVLQLGKKTKVFNLVVKSHFFICFLFYMTHLQLLAEQVRKCPGARII